MKNLIRTFVLMLLCIPAFDSFSQTIKLSSYPSASAVMFLDFDGNTVDGAIWTGLEDPLICAGSGLTDAQATEVFNRVAEDYRPFDINITTDSTKYFAAPIDQRMRVVITTTHQWYPGVGGIAYVGSFIWGDDSPCFVFSAALGYNVKRISEAVAHEAGHTLGLYHQAVYNASCALTSSYNSGTGTGEIGWAPIMGVGYYQNFTLWNNGPNPYGCNAAQNDLTIITSYNGFGYRPDDYNNNFNAASTAVFSNSQFNVSGIIEQNTDKDLVKFILPGDGEFKLNAIPYNVGANNAGSNLDMQVTLYDEDQNAVGVYNPGNTLNLVLDTVLPAGTYFAQIEGKGNQYAPAYASLGSYSMQASFIPISSNPLPLRKLELKGVVTKNKHELNWVIEADENVVKQSIEISYDGQSFSKLGDIATSGRSYVNIPTLKGAAQYRINVTFDNGHQYYSNVVSLKMLIEENYKPTINGNIISGSNLSVNSPGNYNYTVNDVNGKVISKGQLKTGVNAVNSEVVMKGMYFIRFTNGNEQWTEKFIKQ